MCRPSGCLAVWLSAAVVPSQWGGGRAGGGFGALQSPATAVDSGAGFGFLGCLGAIVLQQSAGCCPHKLWQFQFQLQFEFQFADGLCHVVPFQPQLT